MKAYNLHAINDYRYEDVEKPVADDNSVVLEVKACGICGSDIPRIYSAGTYSYPLIPGHEFAGQALVDGKIKRYGVFPLIPCMECNCCQNKQYEMCSNYSYLGSRTHGGFAEYVKVPKWNLIELPDNVTFEQAAMLEPLAVAVHAIRQSRVSSYDTVAVCGLGTIGLFVVMFLKEMGCENILVIGNKDLQKEKVLSLGVSESQYFDSREEKDIEAWIDAQTEHKKVDVFFECVGKNETLITAINCVRPAGIVQLVGNPYGDMTLPKKVYWKILRSQLSVYGTWNSSFTHSENDDWHYVLERLENKLIHPEEMITHKYSLEELIKGFELMRDKKEEYIKVMGRTVRL